MELEKDNFYDEIASYMPTPGEYNLDDLDEIIRSTDSHLDASLDLNIFSNSMEQNESDLGNSALQQQQQQHSLANPSTISQQNEFNIDFSAFPSPAATSHQPCSSDNIITPYETSARTSSTSSCDGYNFNPDDFINFLNDDVKIEGLTHDSLHQLNQHNERNTPSPTGSCSSSSGSSTSGIQSDVSSTASMRQINTSFSLINEQDQDELSEFLKFRTDDVIMHETDAIQCPTDEQKQTEDVFRIPLSSNEPNEANFDISKTILVPINEPVLLSSTFQPAQSVNFVQGTIRPIQTASKNGCATAPIEIGNKTTVFQPLPAQQPIKIFQSTSPTKNGAKVTAPPPTTKPKTIFLSSNDFKALMHKMNSTNGVGSQKKNTFPNEQLPKIIMKTASGKYITANKIPSPYAQRKPDRTIDATSSASALTNSYHQPSQMVTKLFKTSSSAMVKKQLHISKVVNSNSGSSTAMTTTGRASLQHSKNCRLDFNMLKGLSEDKIVKKQLRMLKNRESASLSRKKKKEYIERLENRISSLEKENYALKGENSSLRSQLMAFAQTCDCRHRNVSEFILNTLSMNERRDNEDGVLSDYDASFLMDEDSSDQSERGGDTTSSHCHYETYRSPKRYVRIAPKPLNASSPINRNFRQRINSSTVKKNVAVLFAMAFIVTLNVGNFQSLLNKSALENVLESTAGTGSANEGGESSAPVTGRRLLWVPNEHEFNEKNNRSKREADFHNMPPPPLHFLRPVNRSTPGDLNGTTTKDEPPIRIKKYGPTAYDNATNYAQENNMRLAINLHKWIGGNDYLNITGSGFGIDGRMPKYTFGKTSEYEDFELKNPAPTVGIKQKRKIVLDSDMARKQKKFGIEAGGEGNSLGLYKPRISEEYLKLFKGIKRQDDTFYVLSFNLDHILLPASSYNKSTRPKMSLMLPAGDPSLNGDIVLMKIDCEVINTTEIELKSHMIPEKLRPPKFGTNFNDVANNDTKNGETVSKVKNGNDIHLKREEDSNEKPTAPRTYFIMGPKNQPSLDKGGSETNIKKRPTIVKLHANDSVIGSGVMSVRNSSIFTRMKDTVVNSGVTSGLLTASAGTDVRKVI